MLRSFRVIAALISVLPVALYAQSGGGTIVGVIIGRESGLPLPHAVVAIPTLGRERFSDDSGAFLFADLAPGRSVLRVRRLGYAPMELVLHVRAGVTDTVRIHIDRVAVRLASVNVQERSPCYRPGAPRAADDSTLATVYEQLLLNAEQYRLMSQLYPFAYSLVSTRSHRRKDGTVRVDNIDTLRVVTDWKYFPGQVLRVDRLGSDRGMLMLLVPTLGNFADPDFIENHCFHNGGLTTVDGSAYIKIDVVAAERIPTPDVSGSILLDPRSFQIRRSVLRLSRLPDVPGMTDAEVVTEFRELLPSVPVIGRIKASQTFDTRKRGVRYAMGFEEQHLVNFTFIGAKPGENIKP